jgi:hypothetical protein
MEQLNVYKNLPRTTLTAYLRYERTFTTNLIVFRDGSCWLVVKINKKYNVAEYQA